MDLTKEKWLPVIFSNGDKRKYHYAIFWITAFRILPILGLIFRGGMANADWYFTMYRRAGR